MGGITGVVLGVFVDGLGFLNSGAGHGSYFPVPWAGAPIYLLMEWVNLPESLEVAVYFLAPLFLLGAYGVMIALAYRRPKWQVASLLVLILHIACIFKNTV